LPIIDEFAKTQTDRQTVERGAAAFAA